MSPLTAELTRRLTAAAVRELEDPTTSPSEAAHLAVCNYNNSEPGQSDHDAAYQMVRDALLIETECCSCGREVEWKHTTQEQMEDGDFKVFCFDCSRSSDAEGERFDRGHSPGVLG